jgi:DNA-binding winged helix-turn-helix (wHTH) protein
MLFAAVDCLAQLSRHFYHRVSGDLLSDEVWGDEFR